MTGFSRSLSRGGLLGQKAKRRESKPNRIGEPGFLIAGPNCGLCGFQLSALN